MKKICSTIVITMLLMLSSVAIVSANGEPIADTGGPYNGLVNEKIQFNASGSSSDVNITEYYWEFGDGENKTGKIVNHSYSEAEEYTVNLTVTDEKDNTSTAQTTATIQAPPKAEFTYAPSKPKPDEEITFNASASSDPDSDKSNLTFKWNLGDGTIKENITCTHKFSEEKIYNVTLKVTDIDGYNDTITKQIRVNDNHAPKVDIIKPEKGRIYLFGADFLSNGNKNITWVVGNLMIQVNATDDESIEKVEIYIDEELQATKNQTIKENSTIYEYKWKTRQTLNTLKNNYSIKAIAYDNENERQQMKFR